MANNNRKNLSTEARLFSYLSENKLRLAITIIMGVLSGLFQLLAPLLIARILDAYTLGDYDQVRNIILLLLSYLASLVSMLILGLNVAQLTNEVATKIRVEAYNKLSDLPVSFYDTSDQGDTISRLTNDIQAISLAAEQLFQQLFAGLIILVGAIILMYSMSWKVATLVLLLTPFTFLVTSSIARGSSKLFYKQSKQTGELQGFSEEIISGQQIVSAFAAEEKSQARFDEMNSELYKVGQMSQFISSLTNPGTRLVNNITYVLVGVYASILAASGELGIGQISAFLSYALQFAKPVNEISMVMTEIQQGIASANRVFEIIDLEEQEDESSFPELEFEKGRIEFDNVNFRYVEDTPLIQDFNFKVESGKTIAIVGPTGAGKTTLVNLLMRFYEPQEGAIVLDGQNISKVSRDTVRDAYGMVLQDTWLLRGSIYDNIAYGKENATEEDVYNAAKSAQAHDFIMQLPEGYKTKLADASSLLSTGQKQLLTIARVFISEPEMLILDEATSDIDTRTEILVQEAFDRLMEGKTSFVIAHRLSTIRNADVILVMVEGNIVETGSHDELLDKQGFYYDLYNSQFYKPAEN